MICVWILVFFLLFLMTSSTGSDSCDVTKCANVVSRCSVLGYCSCLVNSKHPSLCSCCEECQLCMGREFFALCGCQCLGICPYDVSSSNEFSVPSAIQRFSNPVTSFFRAIISMDNSLPWTVSLIPQYDSTSYAGWKFGSGKKKELVVKGSCLSVFFNDCMSQNKCQTGCVSLGAGGMRWFFNGCCNCFDSSNCQDLGPSTPKCTKCSAVS